MERFLVGVFGLLSCFGLRLVLLVKQSDPTSTTVSKCIEMTFFVHLDSQNKKKLEEPPTVCTLRMPTPHQLLSSYNHTNSLSSFDQHQRALYNPVLIQNFQNNRWNWTFFHFYRDGGCSSRVYIKSEIWSSKISLLGCHFVTITKTSQTVQFWPAMVWLVFKHN